MKEKIKECPKLEKCPFFKKYGDSKNYMCKGFIEMYCRGPRQPECKRKDYKEAHGVPPSDNMMPNGEMTEEDDEGND